MNRPTTHWQSPGWSGWRATLLLWALAWAMVLSPVLSRMHQVVHTGHSGATWVAPVNVQAADARHLWDRLFGQHLDGSPVCQWLDHCQTSDGPHTTPPLGLSVMPAQELPQHLESTRTTPALAFFEARGPPQYL